MSKAKIPYPVFLSVDADREGAKGCLWRERQGERERGSGRQMKTKTAKAWSNIIQKKAKLRHAHTHTQGNKETDTWQHNAAEQRRERGEEREGGERGRELRWVADRARH